MRKPPQDRTCETFGAYVRNQRQLAKLSLRQAAAMARISNPYLSQIEHGLALPSVTVIRSLAEALHVSADNLLLMAAGREVHETTVGPAATEDSIRHDPRLDDAQKHALLAVLTSFVGAMPPPLTSTSVDDGDESTVTRIPRRRQTSKAARQDRTSHGNP